MNRYCFQLQVAPASIEEYKRRHAAVWPEMLKALKANGWNNYSLFLRPDGLLIGYFETEGTLEQAQQGMAATDVNTRWQREMTALFEGLENAPDTDMLVLEEIFNLEDQLARC